MVNKTNRITKRKKEILIKTKKEIDVFDNICPECSNELLHLVYCSKCEFSNPHSSAIVYEMSDDNIKVINKRKINIPNNICPECSNTLLQVLYCPQCDFCKDYESKRIIKIYQKYKAKILLKNHGNTSNLVN